MGRSKEDWAVFWCSLLSPLRLGQVPERRRERYFHQLSQEERLLPDGQRKRVSVRTLRRWWRRLKEEGVPGLYRRHRNDRGKPRKNRAAMLARAVELKRRQPRRSHKLINRILKREFGSKLPRSTLYRHLRQQGATRRKLGVSKEKVRCRWTREQPGALWVGDFAHGPTVMHHGQAVKTHLSAWIDCHSRYVVEARYYIRENLDILVDSLLRAWGKHGASRELYVDNAKVYHAKALRLACMQLAIQLLHRPPRDPPAGGLIERFIQTCQIQLEAEVSAGEVLTLDDLNRLLAAWLEVDYHQEIHSETEQTPYQRYHQGSRLLRQVDLGAVLGFFQQRVPRTVNKDFSDVRLDGLFFAVDPTLRGDRVIVQYDPFSPPNEVQLYTPAGTYLGLGRLYQREKGSHPQPPTTPPAGPITPDYLDALRAEYAAVQEQRRSRGIDYHSARQRNVWSVTSFARVFARLLGRQGGVSGLTATEMDLLAAFHARHDRLTESLLRQAFQQAPTATLPEILFQLQSLLSERND
ncbi:MAG: DDE-type integrase/transposase/recombinase [Chloroflexi bacterium]|nr:DDE-type integrase/transposase/recombinase [Chloroflexota bacterium]